MSEPILRVAASDLAVLRLTCTLCASAVEIPVDPRLNRPIEAIRCPGCHKELRAARALGKPDNLDGLIDALSGLRQSKATVRVEFVMSAKAAE